MTETRPRGLGMRTHDILTKAGIPCTIILDSAVAYAMDKVDMIFVGCEAVVESGGVVNAIGSLQMAILAKAFNKPVHVLAERCAQLSRSNEFLQSFFFAIVTSGLVSFLYLNTTSRPTTITSSLLIMYPLHPTLEQVPLSQALHVGTTQFYGHQMVAPIFSHPRHPLKPLYPHRRIP